MKYWLPPTLFVAVLLFISFGSNIYSDYGVITLDRKIESRVFDNFNEDILLIFFGYVGCRDVCPPKMAEIAAIYDKIEKKKHVGLLFVNLTDLRDTQLAQEFASVFHKDYRALQMSRRELERLKNEF